MTFPLEAVVARPELASVLGVLVGFGFGFVLERAGFGDARKLLRQFFGTEMVMLKVMFGAIVTAVLGAVVLAGLGALDLRALADEVTSPTFLWPMIAGGFLVGVGIVLSGYCPGTSFVGIGSGKLDAAVAFAGVIVGQLLWAELELREPFRTFHGSGAYGHVYLYDLLRVPPAVVAAAIVAMAAGAFLLAERIERLLGAPAAPAEPPSPRRRVLAGFGGAALVALATLALPRGTSAVAAPAPRIDPEALARRVLDAPWTVRVLDLRPLEACAAARIPGAECAPPEALADLGMADAVPARDVVVVGAGDLADAPPEIRAYRGRVQVLAGGFEAWKAFALAPPEAPAPGASPAALETHRLRAGLNAALTGAAAPPPAPVLPAAGGARPKKKTGGGGCG